MESIFFNIYGRLRSGWRASFFLFAFVFFVTGWTILGEIITSISSLGINSSSPLFWGMSLGALLFIVTILSWLCGKLFEGLPVKAFGWSIYRGWFRDFVLGSVCGILTITVACAICLLTGSITLAPNAFAGTTAIMLTLLVSAVIFILGAAFEEALYRGYIMQTFSRAHIAWLAIILTSVFFALGHAANPNASTMGLVNTVLAGLWFSAAYLKTRSLWFPFTAHFFWNWFQGPIFGVPVSGITNIITAPVMTYTDAGPEWLTGGKYGIEGGIACTIAIALSTIVVWFMPLKVDEEMMALTSKENPAGNYPAGLE